MREKSNLGFITFHLQILMVQCFCNNFSFFFTKSELASCLMYQCSNIYTSSYLCVEKSILCFKVFGDTFNTPFTPKTTFFHSTEGPADSADNSFVDSHESKFKSIFVRCMYNNKISRKKESIAFRWNMLTTHLPL